MRYAFIHKKWWKILGLLVLLYVFVVGFLVPLRPGILNVDPYKLIPGESFQVTVYAYNSQFDADAEELRAFIKYDSIHLHEISEITVKNRTTLELRGSLPLVSPSTERVHDATLIVHDPNDGYLLLPSAFSIQADRIVEGELIGWNDPLGAYDQQWTFRFPFIAILYETVRNMFFHVAIWMAMFVLLIVSLIYSIRYLRSGDMIHDAVAASFTHVAVGLGTLGMITGSIWAKSTWGTFWTDDPKLNMSAVAMMIYLAYTILRASMNDGDRRARVSASYNVFAFIAMIPLIFILPRMMDGLHPGNGGNPGLGGEDLDSTLRLVFYPAIIGYTILGVWIASLLFRIRRIEIQKIEKELN